MCIFLFLRRIETIRLFLNLVNASDKHAWEERFRSHPAGCAFQSGSKTYLLDGVGVGRSRSHLGVRVSVPIAWAQGEIAGNDMYSRYRWVREVSFCNSITYTESSTAKPEAYTPREGG